MFLQHPKLAGFNFLDGDKVKGPMSNGGETWNEVVTPGLHEGICFHISITLCYDGHILLQEREANRTQEQTHRKLSQA